ncbi:hypothetical protein D049_1608A, partial [Vibrio parahaemolyticus VPTS-2010]
MLTPRCFSAAIT